MKKCKTCGNIFPDSYKYCNTCGSSAPSFSGAGSVFKAILKAVAYFAFFEALQVVVTYAFFFIKWISMGFAFELSVIQKVSESVMAQTSLITLVSGVLTVVCLFLFTTVRRKSFFKTVGVRSFPCLTIPLLFLFGIALNFFISIAMSFIPFSEKLLQEYNELYSFIGESNMIIEMISVVIVAPIAEEIIFRGFMYNALKRVSPVWFSALAISIMFGIAHGNLISFVYTTLMGLVLIFANEKTGSLISSVLIHIGFNLGSYFTELITSNDVIVYALILVVSALILTVLGTVIIVICERKNQIENNLN